jgi:translation initiation factor IF-2
VGDTVVFNNNIGKVRGMMNTILENIKEAGPSSPVIIWGLPNVPSVGEKLFSFKDEKGAKAFVNSLNDSVQSEVSTMQSFTDAQFFSSSETRKKLNLIIKTDSQGSTEAINSILTKIDNFDVQLRILYSSTGEVTETDIEFASTSNATILAFNTTAASGAKKLAKSSSIVIQEFDVVYDLFDYIQILIDDLIGPQYDEKPIGKAIVKTVFPLAKSFVAGSLILEGKVTSESLIEIKRNNVSLYKGPITSLKRLKENVDEVSSGLECGIFIDTFDAWRPEDTIEVFERTPKKKNTL